MQNAKNQENRHSRFRKKLVTNYLLLLLTTGSHSMGPATTEVASPKVNKKAVAYKKNQIKAGVCVSGGD